MSMRDLADPGEGAWLEAEIERELAQLSPVDDQGLQEEDEDDWEQEEDFQDQDDNDDDVPESLAVYLERVQSRAGLVEEGLKECEDVMHHTVTHAEPGAVVPFTSSDLLDQLAASTGQNPAELKRRVLQEIEAEERDEEEELGVLDENSNSGEQEEEDGGGGQDEETTGTDGGATAGAGIGENGQTGAVMLYGVDDLERQLTLQLRRFQQEQQVHQRQLQEQLQRRRQEEECWQLEQEERSKQRDADFHKQQEQLEKHKQEEKAKLDAQLQEEDRRKEQLLQQQEQQIQQLSQQTAEEKAAFYKQQEEENQRLETQKQKSAAKIQAAFKSYKVRKIHGPVLKEKRENRKKSWALNRQLEIEKHKKEEELKQRLDEKERKRKEKEKRKEEERKKEEEEQRKKQLEEKERIEEERKRKEVEKRRMEEEEEKIKQEEAERRKREEEEREKEDKRREEEERKRQQEEKKKLEEKKREEERQRIEEERRKKEEAERKEKEDQLRRIQEKVEKRKLEEQEKKRREEEQKKMEEEAKISREAEERLKNTENVKSNNPEHEVDTQQQNSKDNFLVETVDRTVPTPADMTAIADDIERRRLAWMESCRPWSQVSAELKRRKPRKGGRGAAKPASAKNLPELTHEQLLKASKPGTPLDKVEEVNIDGLTGCSLSRLSECPGLVSISVNQCEAQVLYGVQRFTRLQHINVNQNRLSVLVCTGCASLDCLLAAHNQLSSINGLDGCNNLQVIDLSHNKITRIGGLESCVHLHHLDLSHNQLISLRGLQLVPTLLQLDVSHNHLPAADHLQDCALLQHLNLASNTLTKPPSLNNHVLLRSLVLDDNSISSLDVLSTAWLPLLSLLSVKQNSLTQVCSLCHLILLEHLDVSYNQLEDVPGVAGGVSTCVWLHTLNVAGNPLTEDKSYRSDLVTAIPSLCQLDGADTQQKSSVPRDVEVPFVRMCLAQWTQWEDIKHRHEAELKDAKQSGDVKRCLDVQHAHREEAYQLAVDHRYAHEYGEMDASGPADSEKDAPELKAPDQMTNNEKPHLDKVPPKLNVTTDSRTQSVTSLGNTTAKDGEEFTLGVTGKAAGTLGGRTSAGVSSLQQDSSVASRRQGEETNLQSVAATRIQSVWRGYSVRRDIRQHTQDWLAANAIHEAATKIQAVWRGHRLRLRLKRALQAARWEEEEGEEEEEEFGEVDLSSFDLQAAELDQAWAPPQTPTLPTRHAVLGSVSSQHQDRTQPMWDTRQAWQGAPTPPPPSPKHPLPPVKPPSRASSASSQHHPTPPTSRLGSVISTKSEQLTEEWGFKSGTTAELMMKRARRMKARKKKALDPHQRLALQRKLAEKEPPPSVRAPPRRQANRVDYFSAKEAMHQFLDSAEAPEFVQEEHRQKMTYTWVHSQVGHLEHSPETPEHDRLIRRTGSTGTLPRLDPDIIATGRVQLVRTPPTTQMDGLELESVDGTSASDLQSHRERRHSIEGDSPRETLFEPSPPKTNSAPSQKLRERLSRHSDGDKTAGWGSGRRRIQLFKM
ncbi:CEP97 [Branchiostoma lanceolatum]|uniref:CEP97 protein n=1 Tax=Branchiostoma lanceolatum TaxID=7740 RepID=A0A8K0A6Q3_BRALA|nr:CEP97 [Branchiostoma lanceolatum]